MQRCLLFTLALSIAACSSASDSPSEPGSEAGDQGEGSAGTDGNDTSTSNDDSPGSTPGNTPGSDSAGNTPGNDAPSNAPPGGAPPQGQPPTPGQDTPQCPGGQASCSDSCVDTDSDDAHCGGCDLPCTAGSACQLGVCEPTCDPRLECAAGEACVTDGCQNLSAGRAFGDEEPRDSEYSTRPKVDLSATGHAVVVWTATQSDELRVSRYILAQGQWTAPLRIHEAMAPFPGAPHVAVDDAGNATAVWHQGGNEFRDAWANRYDAELNMWLGPQRIEPEGNGFADSLHVVMDAVGNATVLWPYNHDVDGGMVQAVRYEVRTGAWTTPVDLSPQVMTGAGNVTAAVDRRGNVMAAWEQRPPGKDVGDLFTARYDIAAGSWSEAVAIDAQDLGHVNHPNVTVDGNGNFFVAWHQSGEDVTHVWVNRYDVATGAWATAQKLDAATSDRGALWGRLAADDLGNCLAIWIQDSVVMSAHYDADADAWSMLGTVDPTTGVADPRLVVDRGGNGIALWRGLAGRVYASRFDAASGSWGAREAIDPVHADRTSEPDIDMDADGRAVATWHEIGVSNSWEVMTNRFE